MESPDIITTIVNECTTAVQDNGVLFTMWELWVTVSILLVITYISEDLHEKTHGTAWLPTMFREGKYSTILFTVLASPIILVLKFKDYANRGW